ncbi:MAG: hypothetical protein MR270_00385 [Erysipelotrichaceae bacterium]|nr:hypothetical protein [Erysipelotrichaceae bacterium]
MKNNIIFYDSLKWGFNGDFIPFYDNGIYHLFTIVDGSWEHLTTKDFVHYEFHGVALHHGKEDEQDFSCVCTGSLIKHEGIYHIFNAGCNLSFTGKKPIQVIMHATSKDLYNWQKEDDIFMPPDENIYHRDGWRDPFVYYDEKDLEFKMLITGEEKHYHNKRWGCIALATSKDLKKWEIKKPMYKPYLYDTHECPDLFYMNNHYYMVFSTYTRWWENHYLIANSSTGPFKSFKDELLDNRSYYAAKTISNGNRRFLVGWAARRKDEKDDEKYEWGGTLVVHELFSKDNGELMCYPVKEALESYQETIPLDINFAWGNGKLSIKDDIITLDSKYGYSIAKISSTDSEEIYISLDVTLKDNTCAGVVLRADIDKFDKWCSVEIDRKKDRLFFDHSGKWFVDQYFDEQRPLDITSNTFHLDILSHESLIVIYCNGKALSTRCYQYKSGEIGIFSKDGKAVFKNIVIKKNPK